MARRKSGPRGHAGHTGRGHLAYLKVERIGRVSIYKRGNTYSLYYRERGQTVRRPIDGNLTTARATASKVNAALEERRPTPFGFRKTTPRELHDRYLGSVRDVQQLALRTEDRYRAALTRFVEFCESGEIASIELFGEPEVERMIAWLRRQTRARNGMKNGKQAPYKAGGIKFILSTCRTAFAWALRQRLLPPYTSNPFQSFGIDRLRPEDDEHEPQIFTPEQEQRFFAACDEWQKPIFTILATYGLRVGELTHLLIEDVDLSAGAFHIRSKPELCWQVKTRRQRSLPLTPPTAAVLKRVIGGRKAGFVFLHREYAEGTQLPAKTFATDRALRAHLAEVAADLRAKDATVSQRDQMKAVVAYCRQLGQVPERSVRSAFMELTARAGCPEFTRVHDLRHLFSSRAQELGLNPLLVQDMLGHSTLEMTRRYTHLGLDTKRAALVQLTRALPSEPQSNATPNVSEQQ